MGPAEESAGSRVVVVGAGLGGVRTVKELRDGGHRGEIVLVGAEPHAPYDRPPLSKGFLCGKQSVGDIGLCDEDFHATVDLRLGVPAASLDATGRRVRLRDGDVLEYDHLVIATGLTPRTLPAGCEMDGVHTLRTLDDAQALRKDLEGARAALVIGAGFIGCEVAASLRELGLSVCMVEQQPVPLSNVLGEQIGRLVARSHTVAGVDLRCGTGVRRLLGVGRCAGALLSDGTEVAADVVVVGIGSEPAIGWLAGSGLAIADGVLCDERGGASAEGVWAVGDAAAWRSATGDRHRRLEHWTNTVDQARTVARAILGEVRPMPDAPYVWTDQYGLKIQAFGEPSGQDDVSLLEDDGTRFLAVYSRDGMVTGVVGSGMGGRVARLRATISQPVQRIDEVMR